MSNFSFPKKLRVKRRKLFDFIFKNGKKTRFKNLVMWNILSENESKGFSDSEFSSENVKLGLVVSKKIGNAVKRNRVKRLIREAFRLSKGALKDGARIIIYPLAGGKLKSSAQASEELKQLWLKTGIYDDKAKK